MLHTSTLKQFMTAHTRIPAGLALCAMLLPSVLYAGATGEFLNPLGNVTLYDFLILILNALVYILFPVIILMIIYSGFLFVAAQGNEQKLTEAKRALLWTIVGGLVLLGAKAIALAIQATIQPLLV